MGVSECGKALALTLVFRWRALRVAPRGEVFRGQQQTQLGLRWQDSSLWYRETENVSGLPGPKPRLQFLDCIAPCIHPEIIDAGRL